MTPIGLTPNRKPRERGIAVLLAALMAFFLIGTVGLSVDAGLAYLVKGRLMAAVDAASLGAARGLNLGEDVDAANAAATTSATRFFNANFPQNYMGTNPSQTTVTPTFTLLTSNGNPNGILQVDVVGTVTAPTYFMKMFSMNAMRISATGTATRRTLVMMLILDVSGSMGSRAAAGVIPTVVSSSTSSCDAMVYASSKFLDYFSSYDYVGAVTFSTNSRTIYAPSRDYKRSDSAGLNAQLRNVSCGGNTNTAPSINMAWAAIRNVGLRLAMNEILLFTDGMPNVVTGDFPLRTQRDTRLGIGRQYGGVGANTLVIPPEDTVANQQLFYRDSNDPFSPTTYNSSPNTTPTLNGPYTAAQQIHVNNGVPPRYGDSRFLPLTAAQFTRYTTLSGSGTATTTANINIRNSFGWYLGSAAGPYMRKWIQDASVPARNYFNCTNTNTNLATADRGATYMCRDMAVSSLTTSPATMYGGITQATNPSYHPRFGAKANFWNAAYHGESAGSVPSGFTTMSSNGTVANTSTIAHIPDLDAKGNSNWGFRENWVYNVNQGCAPSGTTLPMGATDLCKSRGGLWADYMTSGLGTNRFTAGPYNNKLRPDLPNVYPAAAMNSAVDAALRTKSDTDYNIRFDCVYLVGTEDNVDREFLQIIANVQVFKPTIFDGANAPLQGTNTRYNSALQEGLWYYTTNPADLANLFAQIAGSLLRLSA
jgi:Flp pilus assembly protein TadG